MQQRSFRWGILGFFLFVLLLSAGRMGQVYLQSQPQGARGPYLQMPASDGMTIRWQTLDAVKGTVRYGISMDHLDRQVEGPQTTVHELHLGGLKPDTRYFYSVGEAVHSFRTSPLPGSDRPVRLWVQGDPGRAIPTTMLGRDMAMQWAAAHPRGTLPAFDLWLTTGDNAYRSGKDEEFQKQLFDAYPKLLPTVPYLPVHGNHDARRNAFYRLFTFPTQGEAGGLASGSEHYFSIDYGQLHLIFLDSHDGDLDKEGEMLQWLKSDLAATKQRWIIALLHHPPYTRGSHDSDDDDDSRGRMRRVRENLVPLLEQGGVDLALFGHSHVYERSHLMGCHYGDSQSFSSQMNLQQSAEGEYSKAIERQPLGGTIYSVVGSSARADGGPLDHPAMTVAKSEAGSLIIDVTVDTLSGYFINTAGKVSDRYRITKTEARRPRQLPPHCPTSRLP
jgi:predicted phosphodiesterase